MYTWDSGFRALGLGFWAKTGLGGLYTNVGDLGGAWQVRVTGESKKNRMQH